MATNQNTADFIVEQLAAAGTVSARKMFGEYALYCNDKLVALICDNQLFVKPTAAGRAFVGAVTEAPPYPGAKPSLLIDGGKWDDAEWLSRLIALSATELPAPGKKRPGKARRLT